MKLARFLACLAVILPVTFTGFRSSASPWTETPKKVLCLRLDFTPNIRTPLNSYTEAELKSIMNSASNTFVEWSYANTSLIPTVTSQVLALPHVRDYYVDNHGPLVVDALAAASNAGYVITNYDVFIYSFPATGGGSYAGGVNVFMPDRPGLWTFVHELGHVYGLNHAGFWRALTGTGYFGHLMRTNGGETRQIEFTSYGDPFDTMAVEYRTQSDGTQMFPSGQFSMHEKAYLNWIKTNEVIDVTTNGTYRIYRFDHKDARANPGTRLALQIKIPNRRPEQLWVGFRRNFTNPPSIFSGAYVVWQRDIDPSWHISLNAEPLVHPNSLYSVFEEESALPVRRSYTDPSGSIRITTLGSGGVAPYEYLDVQVEFLTQPIRLFTDASYLVPGLTGSYVDRSLRSSNVLDWRTAAGITIAGTRTDARVDFFTNSWGIRSSVGLTHGSDADWDDFSVQWDGVIVIDRPILLATRSDDGSRMWIDFNGDHTFNLTGPELITNHWGNAQSDTLGDVSQVIPPGSYRIRIQYEEGNGANDFSLVWSEAQFDFVPTVGSLTPGLTGSYVNRSLRSSNVLDWTTAPGITISGTRLDAYPGFYPNGWGARATVGLTGGSDGDWSEFSVQWDGQVRVYQPTRFATISDDSSRMLIDLNHNGNFETNSLELINNHWGQAQPSTIGEISTTVQPGTYPVRIQYEATAGGSTFLLFGAQPELPSPYAAVDTGLRAYDGVTTLRIASEFPGTGSNLVSPMRFAKNGTNFGVLLTEPNSPNASRIRIQTASGTKSIMKLP